MFYFARETLARLSPAARDLLAGVPGARETDFSILDRDECGAGSEPRALETMSLVSLNYSGGRGSGVEMRLTKLGASVQEELRFLSAVGADLSKLDEAMKAGARQ